MSNHVILSDKTFYMPIEVLNALNSAPLVDGTQELPFRGQIKSIRTNFLMPNVSSLNATMLYYSIFVDAKVELLDGSLTTFNICTNANYIQFTEVGNTIQFNFTASENTALEFIDENSYFTLFSITPAQFILMLEGSFNPYGDTMIRVDNTIGNTITLSQTPVIWSNGGPSTPGLALYDGKVVGTVTDNPTQVEVTFNGQPLPTGSVVKFNGQKFLKVSGGSMEFLAIEIAPKAEWGWALSANIDWSTLQGY